MLVPAQWVGVTRKYDCLRVPAAQRADLRAIDSGKPDCFPVGQLIAAGSAGPVGIENSGPLIIQRLMNLE